MHLTKRLFLLPVILLSLSGSKSSEPEEERFFLDDIYAEPAHTSTSWKSKIYISAHSSLGNGYKGDLDIHLYNSTYSGIKIATKTFSSYTNFPSIDYDSTYFEKGRNQLAVTFHPTADETKTYMFLTYIDDTKNQPLNLNELTDGMYQEQRLIHFDVEKNRIDRSMHTYHFYDLPKNVYLDYYSGFSLEFIQMHEFFTSISVDPYYNSLILKVPLYYNIFVDVNQVDSLLGYVKLNVKPFRYSDGIYRFIFVTSLFVNPDTMEMARTYRTGFIPTNKIFLPKNGQMDVEAFHFEITGTLGYMYKKVSYEFAVYSMMNLIGDCWNSLYCVEMHSTKYVDEGKVLKDA